MSDRLDVASLGPDTLEMDTLEMDTLDMNTLEMDALGSDPEAWLAAIEARHPGWDLGLDRVKAVAERMGLLSVARQTLLVAGTNGKGSCCEYLTGLAMSIGLKVGTSTSPHFFRFNERIRINAEPVNDLQLVEAFRCIEAARGQTPLSHFEFSTLASLLLFKEADLDLAVLEIGLGGRLDAMNIVDPDVSVIMSIALDHQQWLGEDRQSIALEKAGIMRPGVPCVYADEDPVAALVQRASEVGAPLRWVSSKAITLHEQPHLPTLSLAAAVQAMAELGHAFDAARLDEIAGSTKLMGRNHRMQLHCPLLLDVAHNPAATQRLAAQLQQSLQRSAPQNLPQKAGGKIHAVTGIYADKDIKGVLAPLLDLVDVWHFTNMDEARAAEADDLRSALLEMSVEMTDIQEAAQEPPHKTPHKTLHKAPYKSRDQKARVKACTYARIPDAMRAALQASTADDFLLVFGSFPVVAGGIEAARAAQRAQ